MPGSKGKSPQLQLTEDEKECIKQTNVNIQLIKRDKNINQKLEHQVDPKFNNYLGCYIDKLRKKGQLQFTQSPYVSVPGYRTKYQIPTIWCDESGQHISGLSKPCAIKPTL
ncbi:hypothetical protein FQA39_LY15411 [Lamprigera yunnana]|nr:hypothetical protein FQA39_LY15411 [Lamprigera yunnana]